MTAVALEGSGRPGSVALRAGGEVREAVLSADAAHASDLLPSLDRLMREARATGPVSSVLVGTGPGSFTGLRVAIATAMGIARGAGARMFGVSSFEALVFAELEVGEEGCILVDARAREVYFAHYRRTENDVEVIAPPRVVPAGAPLALPATARVFADESGLRAAGITRTALAARVVSDRRPSAAAVLRLGERRLERDGPMVPSDIEPLYLRPFAAVARKR
jgi:tRNA threonylcarbamoyl adenosine modification protein YeaZ